MFYGSHIDGLVQERHNPIPNALELRFRALIKPSLYPCLTRPQWVYTLWPSDAIWRQRSGSTLAQVMACCLTAPSHYLNQCWLIISEVQWHSYKGNFTRDASTINPLNLFQNYMSKISCKFPRGQWVNQLCKMMQAIRNESCAAIGWKACNSITL